MAKQVDDFLVDKRIVERNMKKGLLGKKEYEQYLKSLADVEENAEVVDLEAEEEAAEGEATEGEAAAEAEAGAEA